jgi:feruloyl-CoA synthase
VLLDEDDPEKGLLFDGRLSEDFKLTTGTWVSVGRVRDGLVSAAGGVLSHAVIAGHDRDHVAAMAWVDPAAARRACGDAEELSLADPRLAAHLAGCLARANDGAGSARRIERLLLLTEPPNMDRGEITDKGYVNQRAVLRHRSELVTRLFAGDGAGGEVIITSPA